MPRYVRSGRHPLRSQDRFSDDFDVAIKNIEACDERHTAARDAVRQFIIDGHSPTITDLLVRLNADGAAHSEYSLGLVLNTLCKVGRLTRRPDDWTYELGCGPVDLPCLVIGSVS